MLLTSRLNRLFPRALTITYNLNKCKGERSSLPFA